MTNEIKIFRMEDMLKVLDAHQERVSKIVYIKDDFIVINVAYEYRIELTRCDTPEKLLWWVFQLSEKTWMTTEAMRWFVALAAQEHEITLGGV